MISEMGPGWCNFALEIWKPITKLLLLRRIKTLIVVIIIMTVKAYSADDYVTADACTADSDDHNKDGERSSATLLLTEW